MPTSTSIELSGGQQADFLALLGSSICSRERMLVYKITHWKSPKFLKCEVDVFSWPIYMHKMVLAIDFGRSTAIRMRLWESVPMPSMLCSFIAAL